MKDLIKCYCGHTTTCDCGVETLEEAAERRFPSKMEMYDVFIEGAKWQQEQIGKSEFLQKLRATMSDAEARRIIKTI
jgi:hypothetical protein